MRSKHRPERDHDAGQARCPVAILIGGRSTRMGTDKALLPFAGSTLLEHIAGSLRAVSSRLIIAIGAAPRELPDLGVAATIVEDPLPDAGPLAGMLAVLESLEPHESQVFVCSCDLPFLRIELVEVLLAQIGTHDAAIPMHEERRQVLAALYTRSSLAVAQRLFDSGKRSLQAFANALHVIDVQQEAWACIGGDELFMNVNRPTELERARALLARKKAIDGEP